MFILFFLLWVILNGRLTVEIALFGVAVSAAVTFFTHRVFGYGWNGDLMFLKNIPFFIRFLPVLVIEIVKAACAVTAGVLTGKQPEPVIHEFDSGLGSEVQNVILANAITLTPGTYTVVQEGEHFVVHCLFPEYADGLEESRFVKLLNQMTLS